MISRSLRLSVSSFFQILNCSFNANASPNLTNEHQEVFFVDNNAITMLLTIRSIKKTEFEFCQGLVKFRLVTNFDRKYSKED